MINLFEYQNKVSVEGSLDNLEIFLDDIWNSRERNSFYSDTNEDKIESQRFLQFIHKNNELKSNKYVGAIHFEGKNINLLPKIIYDGEKDYSGEVGQIQNHILWYFSPKRNSSSIVF